MIYLDHAATTRVFDEAAAAMNALYGDRFYNPSATYGAAIDVRDRLSEARRTIAAQIGAASSEIVFTSCATEANNWALTAGFKNKKGNLVVSAGEHACVYETAKALQSRGLDVRFVPIKRDGTIDEDALLSLIDENTCLVSVIHVSNETGIINDLPRLCRLVKERSKKALFHSDGVQGFCKTDNDIKRLGVDLYSASAHKIGGPKGTGFLYVRGGIRLQPLLFGGGQENGMRSGTENVAGIVGFATAASIYRRLMDEKQTQIEENFRFLCEEIVRIPDILIIGEMQRNAHMILTVSALGTKAEIVQSMLSDDGILVGRGSACSSRHGGNRVLTEMGLTPREVDGALRISLSPLTQRSELETALEHLADNITKLRGKRIG